jgi:hypothetical protein
MKRGRAEIAKMMQMMRMMRMVWVVALVAAWMWASRPVVSALSDPARASKAQEGALLALGPEAVPDLGQLVQRMGAEAPVQVRLLGAPLRAAGVWERVLRLDPAWEAAYARMVADIGLDPLDAVEGLVVAIQAPDAGQLSAASAFWAGAKLSKALPGDGYGAFAALVDALTRGLDGEAVTDRAVTLLTPMDAAQRLAFAEAMTATSPQAEKVEAGAHWLVMVPRSAQVEYAYLWSGGVVWGTYLAASDSQAEGALARGVQGRVAEALRRLAAAASPAGAGDHAPPAISLVTPTEDDGAAQVSIDLSADTLTLRVEVALTAAQEASVSKALLGLTAAKAAPNKMLQGLGIPAPMHPLLALLLKGLKAEQSTPRALTLTTAAPLPVVMAEVDKLLSGAEFGTCEE